MWIDAAVIKKTILLEWSGYALRTLDELALSLNFIFFSINNRITNGLSYYESFCSV
jgi:hypothetical protein